MPDAQKQSDTNPITELKVTAHLMAMQDGLYCVYNTPGSAAPDMETGLPGVRITAAPGHGAYPGQVGISGFNGDGWLGGDAGAVLVRISGGPAQVLVTVYQDAEGGQDAPKLQVIRLSDQQAAAAVAAPAVVAPAVVAPEPEPVAAEAPAEQPLEVAAHIYGRGDVAGRLGEWMGEPGSKRWVEGFGLAPAGLTPADIEYQAVLGRGWLSPWAEGGQFCGSRGMSLPILGLRVRLRGAAAEDGSLLVSATFVDGTRVGPVADGGAVEAASLSPLEAFQITLQRSGPAGARVIHGAAPAAAAPKAGRKPAPAAAVPATAARSSQAAAPRAAAPPSASPKSASLPVAPPPAAPSAKPAPAAVAPAAKPGRGKAAPAPAEPPAAPAKPAAKRTPATTRRR